MRPTDPLAALFPRIADGDEEALRELYQKTSAQIMGTLVGILGDRSEAEDAVVDVYLHVWRRSARFDPDRGSVRLWLFMVARGRAIERLRGQRARIEAALERIEELPTEGPSPLGASEETERSSRVRAALSSLPEEQRDPILASFYGGLTHVEIAQRSGSPLGTIKTRIRSGLRRLREALSREGIDG